MVVLALIVSSTACAGAASTGDGDGDGRSVDATRPAASSPPANGAGRADVEDGPSSTGTSSTPRSLPPSIGSIPPSPPVGSGASRPLAPGAFASTESSLRQRVTSAGLGGGVVYVVRDGEVVADLAVGGVTRSTALGVASSAKWLTAATLLTFVDEGRISLDEPVSRLLPELAAWQPPITARMLLDHTSGIRDQSCLWATGASMRDCVARLAAGPREFAPGSAFSYGNASFHVAGRLIEVLGDDDFAGVVDDRLTGPLGMADTVWPGAGANPSPAAGLQTTVDDYSRFLALLLAGGTTPDGRRVLSEASVGELLRNQVARYDTSRDYSVGITGIPRYALGAWPDVVDADGTSRVVSGNGGKGFYPWIDLEHRAYGVVGVQDDRGAEVAVPASQRDAVAARQAYGGR